MADLEMVERVARAIYESSGLPYLPSWDQVGDESRICARTMARAAIAAMREPTEAMIAAGEFFLPAPASYQGALAEYIYERMIEAAFCG